MKKTPKSSVSIVRALREVFLSPGSLNVLAMLLILPALQALLLWVSVNSSAASITLFLLVLGVVIAFLNLLFLGQVGLRSAQAVSSSYREFLDTLSLTSVFGSWRDKFALLAMRVALALPLLALALVLAGLAQFDGAALVGISLGGSVIWLLTDSIVMSAAMYEYQCPLPKQPSSAIRKSAVSPASSTVIRRLLRSLNPRKLIRQVRAAGMDNLQIILVALLLPIIRLLGSELLTRVSASPVYSLVDLLLTGLTISIQVLLISHLQGQLWKKYS